MKAKILNLIAGTTFTMLTAVFMAAIGAPPVYAGDSKIYPGTMCVRWSGTNTPTYEFGAIGNPSSTWLYIDCPAVHDVLGKNISSGWVGMIDQNYDADIRCRLTSVYRSGNAYTFWETPELGSTGSSANPQNISYGGVYSNGSTHYYYSCRIPPAFNGNVSRITSYQVNEVE